MPMQIRYDTPFYVHVAQLDRALPCEGKGYRCNFYYGRHFNGRVVKLITIVLETIILGETPSMATILAPIRALILIQTSRENDKDST